MADFQQAITFVLKHEDSGLTGKVTCDSGGVTRYGIAQRAHPEVAVAELTLAQAEEIYRTDYWQKILGEQIEDDKVAAKLLDMAVNMGLHQAVVLCQRAVNFICRHESDFMPVIEDGRVGAKTVEAINGCDPQILMKALRSFCAEFYRHVAAVRPDEEKYLKGWLARANG
jgi:lysozyme family protein